MNVKYDAKGDGGTILVPADQVTKLRMALAQDNLPAAGVGYEIFDKSDAFGTTAFVQNINQLRALEGELARSIQTIDGIDTRPRSSGRSRTPDFFARRPDALAPPWCSRPRGRWTAARSRRSSIWWPRPSPASTRRRVAIVDDRGNLLAGGDDKTGPEATSAGRRIRTRRVTKIGCASASNPSSPAWWAPGHVRVQVAADMNYNHTTDHRGNLRSRQQGGALDPDGRAERHRHHRRHQGAVSVANALPGGQRQTGSGGQQQIQHPAAPRKPPITKSPRRSTPAREDGGDVKHLSVAVVVDGVLRRTQAAKRLQAAHRRRRCSRSTALVKSAMGFDTDARRPGAGHQHAVRPRRCRRRDARAQAASGSGSAPIGSRSSKPRSCASPRS